KRIRVHQVVIWRGGIRARPFITCEENTAVHLRRVITHSGMKSSAILSITPHLIGWMKFLGALALNQSFVTARRVASRQPIFQLSNHSRRPVIACAKKNYIRPA